MPTHKLIAEPIPLSEFNSKLFDQLPFMMWRSGTDTLCTWFNSRWLEFTGRMMEEEIGDEWISRVHPDDLERCLQIYLHNFSAHQPFEMDYRLKHHSGEYRWIRNIGQPLVDAHGGFAGYIGTCNDIHEGKVAELKISTLNADLENQVKRRTAELQAVKERYSAILNNSPLVIWSVDTSGIFTMSEGKGLEALGLKDHEILGQSFYELYKEYPRTFGPVRRALQGESLRDEVEVAGKIFYSYYTPLKDSAGNITGAAAISIDITERKKAEDEFRENEERLKLAIESAVLGTWDLNPGTGELKWDIRCKELFGLSPEANVDYTVFLAGLHPEDRERVDKEVQRSFDPESGGYYSIVYRTIGIEDNIERWVLAKGKALFNDRNEASRFIGTILDITASKKAEIALRESEEYFRTMADNVPVAVWMTEPNGYCNYLNKQWYDYTGQQVQDALGLGWTRAIHPEDSKQAGELFISCCTKQIPFQTIYRLRNHEGNYRWFLDSGLPKFSSRGEYEGHIGVVIDIHDRILAEKELKTTNQELVKINNDLDNFIYTASHDLKAPVANIEGLLHTMLDAVSDENKNSEDFQSILMLIEKSIERFKNTIRDLTDISKAQKLVNEDVSQISCEEIIEDVKFTIREQIEKAGATIEVDVSECGSIRFSRKNFQSIIYNLLSNAVKYRNPEKPLHIHIFAKRENEYMVLTIRDNGLGINELNKGKLFTMFKRFHDHVEGTGIGLYIVKKIIDNAGGKIEVESTVNEGTTFRTFFPIN